MKHIESIQLADEFITQQNIDVSSIHSALLEEGCSARLSADRDGRTKNDVWDWKLG
jgi:hypothetical protein